MLPLSMGDCTVYRSIGPATAVFVVDIQCSVPARLGKGQGAKEIGHILARE